MMGYTHASIGAAGALTVAVTCFDVTPEFCMVASVAGALGGVIVDIDSKDNKKVTDAGRTRIAVLGLLALSIVLDLLFDYNILFDIISREYAAIGGAVVFLIVSAIGYTSEHRTFSHSLLFVLLTTLSVYSVYPQADAFFAIGATLHLILDMLNNPYQGHGVWLFYPIKKGKGIAAGVCKAARNGNKAFYFIGQVVFVGASGYSIWLINDWTKCISLLVIIVYMLVIMHFVRVKSEKEQRHLMHIHGEL